MQRKVEKYEVLDEIGHGGMATVYRARDSSLDRLVALKVLHPHLQRTSEARERFTREAKSVARLHHPHILEIYDYSGEGSEETFIAAELLTGPTVKDFVLEQGEMPPEIAACIALQLSNALSEAHHKGIIHRDVKPENVLIHDRQFVKLTDFGIAHMVDTHTFTATGQILGSPGHMAPEQIDSGHCDERSDVFSLGTVLYFCATGRLPFVGRNAHHLLKLLLDGDYPDPLSLRPEIGADLARIMNKALSRDPDSRYQSAAEMSSDLESFLDSMGVGEPDKTLSAYLSSPDAAGIALRQQSLHKLLEVGAQTAARGEIVEAQAALSRALAIDDGNERALKLLASLGTRRRRTTAGLAAAVLALGVVGIGAFFVLRPSPAADSVRAEADSPSLETVMPTSQGSSTLEGSPMGESDGGSARSATADAEPATQDRAAKVPPRVEDRSSDRRTDATRTSSASTEPRWVVFRPTPSNVSISVDGAPARPFGPDFQGIRLKPGKHTFRFVGAENCCKERVVRRVVPPGSRDFELQVALRFKSSRLYLKGPAPPNATVQITLPGNRTRPGRIREILRIPMDSVSASAQVKIEAPGYATHKGVVQLRAGGELVEYSFSLERLGETP